MSRAADRWGHKKYKSTAAASIRIRQGVVPLSRPPDMISARTNRMKQCRTWVITWSTFGPVMKDVFIYLRLPFGCVPIVTHCHHQPQHHLPHRHIRHTQSC